MNRKIISDLTNQKKFVEADLEIKCEELKAVLNQKSDLLDKNNDLAMKVQGYERSNKTLTQTEEFYEQDKQKEIKKV